MRGTAKAALVSGMVCVAVLGLAGGAAARSGSLVLKTVGGETLAPGAPLTLSSSNFQLEDSGGLRISCARAALTGTLENNDATVVVASFTAGEFVSEPLPGCRFEPNLGPLAGIRALRGGKAAVECKVLVEPDGRPRGRRRGRLRRGRRQPVYVAWQAAEGDIRSTPRVPLDARAAAEAPCRQGRGMRAEGADQREEGDDRGRMGADLRRGNRAGEDREVDAAVGSGE